MSIDRMFLDPLPDLGADGLVLWLNERATPWTDDAFLNPKRSDGSIVSALTMGLNLSNFPRPRNTSDAPADPLVIEFWSRLIQDDVDDTLIRGRAARNLWLTKSGGSPFESAQLATQAFKSIASDSTYSPPQRSAVASETLEIALDLGNDESITELVELHWQLADEFEVASRDHDPACYDRYQAGLTLGPAGARDMQEAFNDSAAVLQERQFHDAWHSVLESLATLATSKRHRSQLDKERLIQRMWDFVGAVEESEILSRAAKRVLEQIVGSSGPDRERYVRWWVATERERVASREPFARWAILSELERLARNEGFGDLASDLQLELQSMDPKSSMTPLRTEFTFPPTVSLWFERRLTSIQTATGPAETLRRISTEGLYLSALTDGNGRRSSGLIDSFPTVQIGHEGVVARVMPADSPDDDEAHPLRVEQRAAREFMMRSQLETDLVLVPALHELFDSFDEQQIIEALGAIGESSGLLDSVRARRAAEAVAQFGTGAFDLSAHALVPRLEYAIRQAAKRLGVSVIRGTDGTSRGGHVSLNQVLAAMTGKIPDELRKHLAWTLTSDLAANLRNDVAHGDLPEVHEKQAALLVHAFLLVVHSEVLTSGPLSVDD